MVKIEQIDARLLACLDGAPHAMPRTARKYLWTDTAAYHVINRGHNRETVFGNDEEMGYFLTLLGRYRDRFDAQIYHYCLMSNHFHLLLWLPQPQRLSSFMAGLLRSYVHFYHRRHGFVGHLWQGRFKSPVVQREGYWWCGRGSIVGPAPPSMPWAVAIRWCRS
jgi:REP element-mobilizing transposase RayT